MITLLGTLSLGRASSVPVIVRLRLTSHTLNTLIFRWLGVKRSIRDSGSALRSHSCSLHMEVLCGKPAQGIAKEGPSAWGILRRPLGYEEGFTSSLWGGDYKLAVSACILTSEPILLHGQRSGMPIISLPCRLYLFGDVN